MWKVISTRLRACEWLKEWNEFTTHDFSKKYKEPILIHFQIR
jgi:hypothetical protein